MSFHGSLEGLQSLIDFVQSISLRQIVISVIAVIVGRLLIGVISRLTSIAYERIQEIDFGSPERETQILIGGALIGIILILTNLSTNFTILIALLVIVYLMRDISFRIQSSIDSLQSSITQIDNRLDDVEQNIRMVIPESEDTDEDLETDGGGPLHSGDSGAFNPEDSDEDENTSGAGLIGGAIAGGMAGSSGGPAGTLLGAILGAAIGETLEKESIENKRKKEIKVRVVQNLLKQTQGLQHPVSVESLVGQFPQQKHGLVREAIDEMIDSPKIPVEARDKAMRNQVEVYLTNSEDAKQYILDNGGELPWEFRG